jgi:ribosomal protein S18 acetylase RimI-like enzyme
MKPMSIEICSIDSTHTNYLAKFFELLRQRGVDKFFHPHPLTAATAREIANYAGKDLYFALVEGYEILGYGMLRGWDEGYDVPSLGIVIHPDIQRQGMGRLLMNFLHVAALRRGAKKVRIRVYRNNLAAIHLYRTLGYKLTPETSGPNLIGMLQLSNLPRESVHGTGQ